MEGSFRGADLAVAQWVADHGRRAGLGSDTLPAAPALYLPLGDEPRRRSACSRCCRRIAGACCCPSSATCWRRSPGRSDSPWSARGSPRRRKAARVAAEAESLRNTLLASISHDLRTPLAVMAGAGSTLADARRRASTKRRALALAHSIETKAREMSELVSNVLDLTRFESRRRSRCAATGSRSTTSSAPRSHAVRRSARGSSGRGADPERSAGRIRRRAARRAGVRQPVRQRGQVHAARHTRPRSPRRPTDAFVRVMVDDDGPGLPPGDPARAVRQVSARQRRGRRSSGVGAGPRDLPRDRARARRRDRGATPARAAARASSSRCRSRSRARDAGDASGPRHRGRARNPRRAARAARGRGLSSDRGGDGGARRNRGAHVTSPTC